MGYTTYKNDLFSFLKIKPERSELLTVRMTHVKSPADPVLIAASAFADFTVLAGADIYSLQ